jgi:hypothetical protein
MKIKSKFSKADEKSGGPPSSKDKDFSKSWSSFGDDDSFGSLSDSSLRNTSNDDTTTTNKPAIMAKLSASFSNLAIPLKGLKKPKRRNNHSDGSGGYGEERDFETTTTTGKDNNATRKLEDDDDDSSGSNAETSNSMELPSPATTDSSSFEEHQQQPPSRPPMLAAPSMRDVVGTEEESSKDNYCLQPQIKMLERPKMLAPPNMRDVTAPILDMNMKVTTSTPSTNSTTKEDTSFQSPETRQKSAVGTIGIPQQDPSNTSKFSMNELVNLDEGDEDIYDSDYMATPQKAGAPATVSSTEHLPSVDPLEDKEESSSNEESNTEKVYLEKEEAEISAQPERDEEATSAEFAVPLIAKEQRSPEKKENSISNRNRRQHRRQRSDQMEVVGERESQSRRRGNDRRHGSASPVENAVGPRLNRRTSDPEGSTSTHGDDEESLRAHGRNRGREGSTPKEGCEPSSRRRNSDRDGRQTNGSRSQSQSRSRSKSRKRNDGRRRRPDKPFVTEQSFKIAGSEILGGRVTQDPPTAFVAPSFKVRPLEEAAPIQFSPADLNP